MSTIITCPKCHEDTDGDKSTECWRCGTFITDEYVKERIRERLREVCRVANRADVERSTVEALLSEAYESVARHG